MSSLTIKSNTSALQAKQKQASSLALRFMGADVLASSRGKTPLGQTSNLRNNTLVQVLGLHAVIQWLVPYAQYQERGERLDGSHKVTNYTTPGTGSGFAQDAIDSVVVNAESYFKRANLI